MAAPRAPASGRVSTERRRMSGHALRSSLAAIIADGRFHRWRAAPCASSKDWRNNWRQFPGRRKAFFDKNRPRRSRPQKAAPGAGARDDIRGGGYRAGEWLRQIDLEQRLGANLLRGCGPPSPNSRSAARWSTCRIRCQLQVGRPQYDQSRLSQLQGAHPRAVLEAEAAVTALPRIDAAALEARWRSIAAALETGGRRPVQGPRERHQCRFP